MCVIVYQPSGCELSGNKFNQCWKHNNDGGGYSYIRHGKIKLKRGFFDRKDMLTSYREDRTENDDSPFLLHFRIATQGELSTANTHPFMVRDDLVMAHNGHIMGQHHKTKSDTHMFVLNVLRELPKKFEDDAAIIELLDGYIGTDKMVFMRADGGVMIMNQSWGKADKASGCWFSNDSYKKRKFTANTTKTADYTSRYTTRPWRGHGSYDDWDRDDTNVESIVIQMKPGEGGWVGEACGMCQTPIDGYDDEACAEVGATTPVCWDCICDKETELIDLGIIMMEFAWSDRVKPDICEAGNENAANETLQFPKPKDKEA